MIPDTVEQMARNLSIGAARAVPLVWSIPVFGGPALPTQLRVAMGVGMAVLCLPIVSAGIPPGGALALTLLFARESLVGIVMGLVVACMFRAAEAAGELVDVLRGATLSSAPIPTGKHPSSPLGALMLLFAVVVFLELGGVGQVATALARSYEAFPVGGWSGVDAIHSTGFIVILASAKLIEAAVGLAAPAMVALLLTDLALGAIGRALPRFAGYGHGTSLKALLGLGAVLIGIAGTDVALQHGFRGFFDLLRTVAGTGR